MTALAEDLCHLSAHELGESLRTRRVSAVDVTQAYLERVERLDGMLNAFITVRRRQAAAEAVRVDAAIRTGRYRGSLHGMALGVKDNIHTAGDLTTAGSKILVDNLTQDDASAVRRLKRAGGVVLGKLSLMEFAMGDDVNPLNGRGPTRNPWDPSRSASGSSSGSAVAIAAALCAVSIGTDTGGSIRLPAAFCGVVGMKPTFGRISRHGVIPLSWSMDCVGPISRSVTDNAMLLQAMAGHDLRDQSSIRQPVDDYTRDFGTSLSGMRIGIPKRFFMEYAMPNVAAAVESAAQQLEKLGARLCQIDLPNLRSVVGAWTTIVLAEMAAYHERYLRSGRLKEYTEMNRLNFKVARTVTAIDYVQSQRLRNCIIKDFQRVFRDVDIIIAPVAPDEANPIEEDFVSSELPKRATPGGIASLLEMTCRMTAPASLAGLPALALPCGYSSCGLPLGAQLIGPWFEERTVYRAAFAYEQATQWHERKPNLNA